MKALQTIIAVATLLHAANTFAQTEEAEDATSYKAEVFGSASSGSTTPFPDGEQSVRGSSPRRQ
ncbi:hypothetical protein NXW71_07780 [Parabacteroides merdae]|nr:hypothetical protein [Parabacteroides merdae]